MVRRLKRLVGLALVPAFAASAANQPVVIDFATLDPATAAAKFSALRPPVTHEGQPPSVYRDHTYGDWPNRESNKPIDASGSLVGAHTVKGNYTPTMNFTLGPGQDFMPAVHMGVNQKNPTRSATLGWDPVGEAKGYLATMIGGGGEDTVVMWSSSAAQMSAFGMPEYLSNGEIARLVGERVLMPTTQNSCVIPQEAMAATGRGGMYTFVAYGGEADFADPPRPPAPKAWHIAWTAKVRYRSSTSGVIGMNMHGPSQRGQSPEAPPQDRPKHRGFGFPGIPSIPGIPHP